MSTKATLKNGLAFAVYLLTTTLCFASEEHAPTTVAPAVDAPLCKGYGPQTPRDIDNKAGDNHQYTTFAPPFTKMNLCNLHFHKSAEHRAKAFSIPDTVDAHGHGGGFQCAISKTLSTKELQVPKGNVCEGLKPGDTIEVHWVHTSCQTIPGEGLAACSSASCSNPTLRVEAQVFTLVNDKNALNFESLSLDPNKINGFYQAKKIPSDTGTPVEFLGSTTGPKYNDQQCSPLLVTWDVRPSCAKLNINSLAKWCKNNVFKENHGHGVRKLVTDYELLSEIE